MLAVNAVGHCWIRVGIALGWTHATKPGLKACAHAATGTGLGRLRGHQPCASALPLVLWLSGCLRGTQPKVTLIPLLEAKPTFEDVPILVSQRQAKGEGFGLSNSRAQPRCSVKAWWTMVPGWRPGEADVCFSRWVRWQLRQAVLPHGAEEQAVDCPHRSPCCSPLPRGRWC